MTRGEGPTRTRGVTWWIEESRGRHWRPRKASLAVVGSADRAYQPVWPPGWLAGQPVDQYCHGYDVQRGGERREEASRWRLAGWLAGWRERGLVEGWLLIFRLHTRGLRTRPDSRAAERRFRLEGEGWSMAVARRVCTLGCTEVTT